MKKLTVLLVAVLLFALLGGAALAQSGSAGWFDIETNFRVWLDAEVRDDLTVYDQLTTADLTTSDDLTVTDDASVAGNLTVGEFIQPSKVATVTVTAGSTITPTGTYQPLASGGVVATSTSVAIADGTTLGQLLLLINGNASDAITIDGTGGNVECKTDKALGAKDTLLLFWGGADWYCLSLSDNS